MSNVSLFALQTASPNLLNRSRQPESGIESALDRLPETGDFRPQPWADPLGGEAHQELRLRQTLEGKDWDPRPRFLSSMGDPYAQDYPFPRLRPLLPVFLDYGQPVELWTSSRRILRDVDFWVSLCRRGLARVFVLISGGDENGRLRAAPRSEAYVHRWELMEALVRRGVSAGIFLGPSRQTLTRREEADLILRARDKGALWARRGPLSFKGQNGGQEEEEWALHPGPEPWYLPSFSRPRREQLVLFPQHRESFPLPEGQL